MPSPFPTNCELVFQVGTPTNTRDRVGNPVIVFVPLIVKASVSIDSSKQNRQIAQPGDDLFITYFKGRFILPKYVPPVIDAGAKARCQITDLASKAVRLGEFTVTQIHQSRWKQVAAVLGSSFEGFLIDA